MVHEAVRTDLPSVGLPFSWGVRWGDLVFVAGQGPLDRDGKVIEGRGAIFGDGTAQYDTFWS